MKNFYKLLEGAFDPPPPLSDREKEEMNTPIENEDKKEFERRKKLKEKREKFNLGKKGKGLKVSLVRKNRRWLPFL